MAKASRKAYIIPKENPIQSSLCKNEELKNKDALVTEAVCGTKVIETHQMPVALVTQNMAQAKEQVDDDANTLKKVDSSSVAHKSPPISNSPDNQAKRKQRFSSDVTETRPEKNYFMHMDQGGQNILDDQEVPHEIDSFTSKLKPTVQKLEF